MLIVRIEYEAMLQSLQWHAIPSAPLPSVYAGRRSYFGEVIEPKLSCGACASAVESACCTRS